MKITLNNHVLDLKNIEKPLFEEENLTKLKLINYYQKMFKKMRPYFIKRPIMLHRFPDGISKPGFYQKNIFPSAPSWMKYTPIQKKEGHVNYLLLEEIASIIFCANEGTIEFHGFLSTIDKLKRPNYLIFDLDPENEDDFAKAQDVAMIFKKHLESLSLTSYPLLTGSKGMHIWVPLNQTNSFEETHAFSKNLAQHLSQLYDDLITDELPKEKRKGRVFVDYTRNSYGQNSILPYAIRARPHAPIAMPISWEEASSKNLTSTKYKLAQVLDQDFSLTHTWDQFFKNTQNISHLPQAFFEDKKKT